MPSQETRISSIIALLFATETALHDTHRNQALQDLEQALQKDIAQCLESLHTWISLSDPNITMNDIQENIEGICQLYPLEVHAWENDVHAPIHLITDHARRWMDQRQKISSYNDHTVTRTRRSNHASQRRFIPTLSENDAYAQAILLKALADPTRLRILSLLSLHEGDVCVEEIVQAFPLEQPTISHHLRIMRMVNLVECRKQGLWAYYYIRRNILVQVQEIIASLLQERA